MTKLYELVTGAHFILEEYPNQPPGEDHFAHPDHEYKMGRLDGMYCYCFTKEGERVYFAAWTEVQEV